MASPRSNRILTGELVWIEAALLAWAFLLVPWLQGFFPRDPAFFRGFMNASGHWALILTVALLSSAVFAIGLREPARQARLQRRDALLYGLSLAALGTFLSLQFASGPERKQDATVQACCFWLGQFIVAAGIPIALRSGAAGVRSFLKALAYGLGLGAVCRYAAPVFQHFYMATPELTLRVVYRVLCLIQPSAFYDHDKFLIGFPQFNVMVSGACSGYEGIGAVWIFLTVYIYLFRDRLRFPHAWGLYLVGGVVSWLSNIFRILVLIGVGLVSRRLSWQAFHSASGWSLFLLNMFFLIWLSSTRFFARRGVAPIRWSERNPDNPLLVPILVHTGLGVVTAMSTYAGVRVAYPVQLLGTVLALWLFRKQYRPLLERGMKASLSLASALAGVVVAVAWLAFDSAPHELVMDQFTMFPSWFGTAWLIVRCTGYTLVVPIIEELAFRGFLDNRLRSLRFRQLSPELVNVASLALSSLIFGALHGRWVLAALAGLVYGALNRFYKGNILAPIIAHAVTNSAILVYGLWTNNWAVIG